MIDDDLHILPRRLVEPEGIQKREYRQPLTVEVVTKEVLTTFPPLQDVLVRVVPGPLCLEVSACPALHCPLSMYLLVTGLA